MGGGGGGGGGGGWLVVFREEEQKKMVYSIWESWLGGHQKNSTNHFNYKEIRTSKQLS